MATVLRVVGHLFLFAVVMVTSLVAAAAATGAVIGRDIGFAGAGILLLFVPAAIIGVALAYALTWWRGPEGDAPRAAMLVGLAWIFSAALAGGPWAAWKYYSRSPPAPQSEMTFAYLPGPDYHARIEITAPATATVGERFPIRVRRVAGGWKKVRVADLPPGTQSFTAPPGPEDPRVLGPTEWPGLEDVFRVLRLDENTGEGEAVFARGGMVELRASARESLVWNAPVWSNAVIVGVSDRWELPPPR